ncbi:MAG: hypothetical protein WAW06_05795 [bacterium]
MVRIAVLSLFATALVLALAAGCGDDGGPGPVTGVNIAPDSLDAEVSDTIEITASVDGGTTKAVAWYVNGVSGGNSTWGTIGQTATADYHAPDAIPDPATVVVTAVAQEDTTKRDSCFVTVRFTLIHVNGSTGNDQTGTGAIVKPVRTLLTGLGLAQAGMDVVIAAGTYNEFGLDLKAGVTVRSASGDPAAVTIDAQGQGRIFRLVAWDTTTAIEGLTLTGGHSSGEGHGEESGGAIYLNGAHLDISRCDFTDNVADLCGGAITCHHSSSVEAVDCVFTGDSAAVYGGAYYQLSGGESEFVRCIFLRNSAGTLGGAVLAAGGLLAFTNCTLCANVGGYNGCSGIHLNSAAAELDRTIIAYGTYGEAVNIAGGMPSAVLVCCDIFGNASGNWTGPIASQLGVDGNFSLDPRFCDYGQGDLGLLGDSPCLPGQHPTLADCGLIGAAGAGCD